MEIVARFIVVPRFRFKRFPFEYLPTKVLRDTFENDDILKVHKMHELVVEVTLFRSELWVAHREFDLVGYDIDERKRFAGFDETATMNLPT